MIIAGISAWLYQVRSAQIQPDALAYNKKVNCLLDNIWTIIGLLAFGLLLLCIVAQAPGFFAVCLLICGLLLPIIIIASRRREQARKARRDAEGHRIWLAARERERTGR